MADRTGQIEKLVGDFITSYDLIRTDELVLAAVSGGQDSMAMLSILHSLSSSMGFRLAAAHFDHMLRKDSAEDRTLVEQFAAGLSVPLRCGSGDVTALASEWGDTIEEAARKARYRFLEEAAEEMGASRISTGHTRDDQVETVLMRVIRGTGLRGLAGIPLKRDRLIRPLLGLARADTLEYCTEKGIPFNPDPTNLDKRFMRNRIRLELIPLLRGSYHPAVDVNVLSLSENARILVDSIRERTSLIMKEDLKKVAENEWVLRLDRLFLLDSTTLFIILSDIFGEHLRCDMDFSKYHYDQLIELCSRGAKSGKEFHLPGVRVRREFDELVVKRVDREEAEKEETISLRVLKRLDRGIRVPGETRLENIRVIAEVIEGLQALDDSLASTEKTAYFSLDSVTPPIRIRTPVPGDRIRPFGMSGTKKLSDIFIDKKVPARSRAGALVVSDAREIMWVVGVITSESFRVREDTRRILRLTVTRE